MQLYYRYPIGPDSVGLAPISVLKVGSCYWNNKVSLNFTGFFIRCNSIDMLAKVNNIDIDKNKLRVSKLDIDGYGFIVILNELELKIPANDNSIIQTLQNSSYAAIFTEGDTDDDNNSTIILANGITIDELNKEKSKTIDKVVNKK